MRYFAYILTLLFFYSIIALVIWISKNPWWCLMTLFTPTLSEQEGKSNEDDEK
jgi:hypothetical protein